MLIKRQNAFILCIGCCIGLRGFLPGQIESLEDSIVRFTEDRAVLSRTFDLPYCREHEDRWEQFYTSWLERLDTVAYDELDADGRLDFHLFRNHLLHEQLAGKTQREHEAALLPDVPHAGAIVRLDLIQRHLAVADWASIADTLEHISSVIGSAVKRLDAAGYDRPRLRAVRAMHERLWQILKTWNVFYEGYDPLYTWWMEKPFDRVSSAVSDYTEAIGERLGKTDTDGQRPIVGRPIGRDGLIRELREALIGNAPEFLLDIGKKEYAWCKKRMIEASQELGFGKDWLQALEHVKTLHVAPGEQPGLIRKLALEAIDYVEANDLLTVPDLAKETWKMRMMSPERQLMTPFFTGGEWISVSFPTESMAHPHKLMSLRGNNEHFCRATVHHELIPGHHLQGFMTRRYKPYRRIFHTPFWLEGWPLHWEMLLWDQGFARGPEDRIGMLFWRMHRAARIIFSLSFHLGEMMPQECVDFLVQQVGHEPANAEAEVRRSFEGDYPPLYQAAYLLGGLQMRALFKECTDSGKYTPKAFHDAVLRENSIPIVLLRAKLLDQPLGKTDRLFWDFSDQP